MLENSNDCSFGTTKNQIAMATVDFPDVHTASNAVCSNMKQMGMAGTDLPATREEMYGGCAELSKAPTVIPENSHPFKKRVRRKLLKCVSDTAL